MNISDLFSNRTKEAISNALQKTLEKKQRALDTEELLWGLLKDNIVMTKVFKELGLKPDGQLLQHVPSLLKTPFWANYFNVGQSITEARLQPIHPVSWHHATAL